MCKNDKILTGEIFFISAFILYYLVCLITGLPLHRGMKWFDLVVLKKNKYFSTQFGHPQFFPQFVYLEESFWFSLLMNVLYALKLLHEMHTVNVYIAKHRIVLGSISKITMSSTKLSQYVKNFLYENNILMFSIRYFIKFCFELENSKNKYFESYKEMCCFVADFYDRPRPIIVHLILGIRQSSLFVQTWRFAQR